MAVDTYKDGYAVYSADGTRMSKKFNTQEEAERWEKLLTKGKIVE